MSGSPIVAHTNPDCLGRGALDLVVPPEVAPTCKLCLDPQVRELLSPLENAVVGLKRRARSWATAGDGEAPTYEAPAVNGGVKVGRVGGRLLSIGDLIPYRLPSFIGL